jgi:hypothetical protein
MSKAIASTRYDGAHAIICCPKPGIRVRGEYLGVRFVGVILQYRHIYIELDEPIRLPDGRAASHVLISSGKSYQRVGADIVRIYGNARTSGLFTPAAEDTENPYRTFIEAE